MARIVAKALNCEHVVDGEPDDTCEACVSIREGRALDVIEMDAASNNKVDDIREFLPRVATVPRSLRRKVFIVDEVQRIKEGWDLLLKTLEEPPDHVAFIFCTTDASQVRPAVLSRIQRFDFRPLTVPQIEGKLRRVIEAEGRQADDDAIALVARLAAGGMRDAESMLDQLLTAAPAIASLPTSCAIFSASSRPRPSRPSLMRLSAAMPWRVCRSCRRSRTRGAICAGS